MKHHIYALQNKQPNNANLVDQIHHDLVLLLVFVLITRVLEVPDNLSNNLTLAFVPCKFFSAAFLGTVLIEPLRVLACRTTEAGKKRKGQQRSTSALGSMSLFASRSLKRTASHSVRTRPRHVIHDNVRTCAASSFIGSYNSSFDVS